MTIDYLINAIRNADSLSDLKRFVGCTEEEKRASERRVKAIDKIWDKHGSFENMPMLDQDHYNRLNREQTEFENMYC